MPRKKIPFTLEPPAGDRDKALILAVETLALYAAPSSYHAIVFLADRPAGWFADDVSYRTEYNRPIPGKEARKALAKIKKILAK